VDVTHLQRRWFSTAGSRQPLLVANAGTPCNVLFSVCANATFSTAGSHQPLLVHGERSLQKPPIRDA
jgi:hypothetical protein